MNRKIMAVEAQTVALPSASHTSVSMDGLSKVAAGLFLLSSHLFSLASAETDIELDRNSTTTDDNSPLNAWQRDLLAAFLILFQCGLFVWCFRDAIFKDCNGKEARLERELEYQLDLARYPVYPIADTEKYRVSEV